MLTAKEMAELVGREGEAKIGAFTVKVIVLDVKLSYGSLRFLVTPYAGEGQAWMASTSIYLDKMGV